MAVARGELWDRFGRNLPLRLVAVGVAVLLWLLVAGQQPVERSLRVPLEFTNLPPQLEVLGDAPDSVDVRVRGSSGSLGRIPAGELVAVLDLASAKPGRRLFHVGNTDVRTPFGLDVVQVSPSSISMTFEPSGSKVVAVVPNVEGEPAAGFRVGAVVADPVQVDVLGPRSVLDRLSEATTEPVSVAGASAPVTDIVTVGVADAYARLRAPQRARVRVDIVAAPVSYAVPEVPVQAPGAARPVDVTPRVVAVQATGPRESAGSGASAFEATVDVRGLRPGTYRLPVRVLPPPGFDVTEVDPAEVEVRVR